MSSKLQANRDEIQRMVRAVPFRPFAVVLDSGERIIVNHPENIAFDPGNSDGSGGSPYFYIISNRLRVFGTFEAISSIITLDHAEV